MEPPELPFDFFDPLTEPLLRSTGVRRVLEHLQFFPSKSLGQNFLVDANIRNVLLDAGEVSEGQHVLEVGPGLGALTEGLLARGARVTAIEKDHRLAAWLETRFAEAVAEGRLEVRAMDGLAVDYGSVGMDRFVRNLPYSVGSRVLFDLFKEGARPAGMVVTVQKEVGDRLIAGPGTGQYGILAVCGQVAYEVDRVRVVPGSCFHPRPRVDSAIVRFRRRAEVPATTDNFRKVVKHCFGQRRKQLGTSLRSIGRTVPEWLDAKRRPESLSVEEWVQLGAEESE